MRCYLIFFVIMLTSFAGVSSMAATKIDFNTVDVLTYRYYQEKKWDSLIVIGKQALRQDIDYYYLRVRLGIAYFEKKAYFQATTHLEKAWQFNSGDPVIANYLYFAYLYSNRFEEAGLIKSSMSEEARQNVLIKHSVIYGVMQEVHAEGGYTISSDNAPENLTTLTESDSIYGEQDLYGNSSNSNFGLKLKVSNRIGLTLAYNYLNFTKTKYIRYGRIEDHFQYISDSSGYKIYHYDFPRVMYDTAFTYHVKQHEAYIAAVVVFPWGLKIMPVFHFIHVSYPVIRASYSLTQVPDTSYYNSSENSYGTFSFDRTIYSYARNDTSFNNYLAAIQISKVFRIFNVALSGSWSNLNGKKQKQADISLTCYPLGNLDLYSTTTATGFFQGKDKRLLLSQILGFKITSWMWWEANFYLGNYTNANIFNGYIVYNNSDIIDYRGGANLLFFLGSHFQLSLIYQYFRKESRQYYYTKDPATNEINEIPQTRNNPYYTNTLIGGITWKF